MAIVGLQPLTSFLPLTPPVDLVSAHTGLVSAAATTHKSVYVLKKKRGKESFTC